MDYKEKIQLGQEKNLCHSEHKRRILSFYSAEERILHFAQDDKKRNY
jgi:hypothetical protein